MTNLIIKANLLSWLSQLLKDYSVVAPVNEYDSVLFKGIEQVEDIVLDFKNTALSPKHWFFPSSETLFKVQRKDNDSELIPASIDKETVIFGIRPCDARGISQIDKPFLAEPADTLYQEHRDKTILIGLACVKSCDSGFCSSMGTSPNDTTNVDILLTQVGDDFLVQENTAKGKTLLSNATLSQTDIAIPEAPPLPDVPAKGILEIMPRLFESIYWSQLADRCIHCNICSYVCPNCYCFDIRDYKEGDRIERVRSWESCQSPGFTKIAGGHDPRSNKGARLRQRFYHKLFYFPKEFGQTACVGCGRCVKSCPVNIDIREIISDVQRLGGEGGSAHQ